MTIEITNQVRIQQYEDFWYTVEDTHLDVGCDGCTISYWVYDVEKGDKRVQHICSVWEMLCKYFPATFFLVARPGNGETLTLKSEIKASNS